MAQIIESIFKIANNIDTNYHSWRRYVGFEKLYIKRSKATGVLITKSREGEDEYMKKWKRISRFVSPIDYRLYSQYIGNDPRIVPECVLRNVIEPVFHPIKYRDFYNDKNMYDKLLPKSFLAESLFRCIEGVYCDGDYTPIANVNDQLMLEMCKKHEKVIVKPTHDTGNGNSILLFELNNNGIFIPVGHKEPFSVEAFVQYYNGNFVIQECLKQSSFTAQFNPSSVNTFRIFTYKSVINNEVHVLGITFRMGKNGAVVDNCHAGGSFVGVSHDGSFLNPCVFDFDGKKYPSFNGIDFSKSFVVPNILDIIAFSKSVGERICHNRTLDLDVMLDENNKPKLIEFNVDACSSWLYQFSTGTIFGEYTDEVIDYIESELKKSK